MTMTDKDICLEYRQAKNPEAQIGILAELNLCSREKIQGILKKGGALDTSEALRVPDSPEALRERCKRVLKERGISQRELASSIGIAPSTLSNVMKGRYPPSEVTARKLTVALDKLESEEGIPAAPKLKPTPTPKTTLENCIVLTKAEAERLRKYIADVRELLEDLKSMMREVQDDELLHQPGGGNRKSHRYN